MVAYVHNIYSILPTNFQVYVNSTEKRKVLRGVKNRSILYLLVILI